MIAEKRHLVVTPSQFSEGWAVFGGFRDGRVVTHHFPMRKVGETREGHVIVLDKHIPLDDEDE